MFEISKQNRKQFAEIKLNFHGPQDEKMRINFMQLHFFNSIDVLMLNNMRTQVFRFTQALNSGNCVIKYCSLDAIAIVHELIVFQKHSPLSELKLQQNALNDMPVIKLSEKTMTAAKKCRNFILTRRVVKLKAFQGLLEARNELSCGNTKF